MSKVTRIAALILPAVMLVGCENPKVDDAHLLIAPQEQVYIDEGVLMPDAGEADVVEAAAAARDAYEQALANLIGYYESTGNATKLQWARNEWRTFNQMVHYQYLMPGEWLPQNMTAMNSVEEADALYDQAMSLYRQSGSLIIVTSAPKLRQALGLFNQIITDYPNSDKIDDAAYRAGRIYEHFKDYELAAVFYQRAFQWNEQSRYPARFRAAYVLDYRLRMRKEALALYKLAVEKESMYANNTEFATLRIAQLTEPSAEPMMDEAAPEMTIEGE